MPGVSASLFTRLATANPGHTRHLPVTERGGRCRTKSVGR